MLMLFKELKNRHTSKQARQLSEKQYQYVFVSNIYTLPFQKLKAAYITWKEYKI